MNSPHKALVALRGLNDRGQMTHFARAGAGDAVAARKHDPMPRFPPYAAPDAATSARMAKVKTKRGPAETAVAKALWRLGYRYRLNCRALPGSPDIAILRHHVAVFIDGEFWHGYYWDQRKPRLKRNRDYWIAKIEGNMARDMRSDRRLAALGWTPVHFGELEVKKDLAGCVRAIDGLIQELALQDCE